MRILTRETARGRTLVVCLATLAAVMLAAVIAPSKAWAWGYSWKEWDGQKVVSNWNDIDNMTVLDDISDGQELDGWYIVNKSFSDGDRPHVKVGGTCNILLYDGATMELSNGINVPPGSELNIYGHVSDTGKLYVGQSKSETAAIGGDSKQDSGTINIHGGTIEVEGGSYNSDGGAGIGGGYRGKAGQVNIYGGTITAKGGADAAGIGGGDEGEGGNINIYGGTITALDDNSSYDGGAGIGGGDNASGGTIKIYGGTIDARGGQDGSGIGGGDDGGAGNIEIMGGTITATGGKNAAGIGCGEYGHGGTVTIGGPSADVTATGGAYGAGIGGGEKGNCDTVKVHDGKVKATGGMDAAGIGGGEKGQGGTVEITGGTVTAIGSPDNKTWEGGAGIGGGEQGDGGTTIISGGTVIAEGGVDAAGIGGGDQGNGGTVNISGGTVTATGGECAAGIGGGDADAVDGSRGKGGTVTITGGTVTATGGKYAAGIGSSEEGCDGGTVVIGIENPPEGYRPPTVTATGGYKGAGIGGGDAYESPTSNHSKYVEPKGAKVTIYNGTVNATGGTDAAGIGGGEGCSNDTTKIYGGMVTATAGQGDSNDGGAGIGSGDDGYGEVGDKEHPRHTSGGTIEIYGGTVIAKGANDGAGIGGGDFGSGGDIKIAGGKVTASGGAYGAGIGGGQNRGGGTITITGGTVNATGGTVIDEEYGGAGIGSGARYANAGESTFPNPAAGAGIGEDVISISGDAQVFADGGKMAAGIGGGTAGHAKSIAIEGSESCTVQAKGGTDGGAGIGGGRGEGGVSGKITINGGAVMATGGDNGGAGIGTGAACKDPGGSVDTVDVTVLGGNVTAKAGAMSVAGRLDVGAAIGTGGQYLKDELKDVEIEGFEIKDVDVASTFRGSITLQGGRVDAYGATVSDDVAAYANGAQVVLGTTRSSNLSGGTVKFSGATVYMFPGGVTNELGSKTYSQAVRAATGGVTFEDTPDYQHVWYVLSPEYGADVSDLEVIDTKTPGERFEALAKHDKDEGNYGLVVVQSQHKHAFNFDANGANITATCTKDSCPLTGNKATLSLKKPLHAVYGDGLDPNVVVVDTNGIQGDAPVLYYKAKADGTPVDGVALDEAPTDAGTYLAEITLSSDTSHATAKLVYDIEKASNPAIVTNRAFSTRPGSVDLSDFVDMNGATGELTYAMVDEITDGSIELSEYGTLTVWENASRDSVSVSVAVGEDSNYKALPAKTITVQITDRTKLDLMVDDIDLTYGDMGKKVQAYVVDPDTGLPFSGLLDGKFSYYAVSDELYKKADSATDVDLILDDPCIEVGEESGEITVKRSGTARILVIYLGGDETEGQGVYGYKVVEVTVKPRPATITAGSESIHSGTQPQGSYEVEADLVEGDTLVPTIAYQKNGAAIDPLTAEPGVYDIVPYGADSSGNYKVTYIKGKLTIKRLSPVTVVPTATVMAGGNTVNLASCVNMNGATGAVRYAIVGDANGCTLSDEGVLTSGDAVGTVTVSVEVDADGNFDAMKKKTITVTIESKRAQTITAPAVSGTYGITDVAVTASVVNPLTDVGAISYAVKDGSEEYIAVDPESGALTIKAVPADGLAYVVVTAAETGTCQAATVDVLVHISRARLTVAAAELTAYVGGTVPDLSNPKEGTTYALYGLVNGDGPNVLTTPPTLAYEKDGEPASPDTATAGIYDIVASDADAGSNYTIDYQNGLLTIKDRMRQTVTASDVSATYGEAGKSIGATSSGGGALSYTVNGDAVSVDENGALTINKAGTAYVTITAAGTDEYEPATKEVKVTIYRAQLIVTAKDEQIYAGGTPVGFYDTEGLIGDDVLTTPPTMVYRKDGVEVDPRTAPAGVYEMVPTGADSDGKYTISYVNAKLTIKKEQAITASDMIVTYGDTGIYVKAATNGDGALGYSVKEGGDRLIDVDGSTGALTIKRAGVATITVAAAETDTYAPATKDVKVTIDKKNAVVSADDMVMWKDDKVDPATLFTATVDGVIPGDTLDYSLYCGYERIPGAYPIRVAADPSVYPNYNYIITTKTGTLTVTNANVSVNASGWSGAYDGKPHGISVDVTVPEGTSYDVAYGMAEGTYDFDASPTQTDVGSLTVHYKVTVGEDVLTGSKDVVVEKAAIEPSVAIKGWKWGEEPSAPELSEGSNPGGGNVTYEYARKGGSDWSAEPPTACGDYTLLATVPETTNYLGGTATADFSVAPVEAMLTFDLAGGVLDGKADAVTVKANRGDTVKLPGAPARDGYVFTFWKDSEGKRYAAGADYKAEGDRTFVAEWERQHDPTPAPGPEAKRMEMYRLYNPYTGEHFYTASVVERDAVVAAGWNYEGVGWIAPAEGAPVFRVYNPYAGDHHYTMSEAERDYLVSVGWNYEGVGWHSAVEDEGVPLWRQYNPNATSGSHNYTTSEAERDYLVSVGWSHEGVGWYGLR